MSPSRAGSTPEAVLAGLRRLVEPVVTSAGFDLEELVLRQAGQRSVLRVVIDSDDGVSLDAIADVSHAVSDVLDAEEGDLGRAPFVLEVTSRGVDRPLTEPRHWRRNVGRLVVVDVAGRTVTGRVLAVTDRGVTLDVQRGGGKGRVVTSAGERTLSWDELGAAHVQIEFSRPAGHRDAPLAVEDDEEGGGAPGDDDEVDDVTDDDDEGADAVADDGGGPDGAAAAGGHGHTHGTGTDHGPDSPRDDAGAVDGRASTGRRRAPRAGRSPRGGRQ